MPYELATCSDRQNKTMTPSRRYSLKAVVKESVTSHILNRGLTEAEHVAKGTPTEACHCSIHDAQHLPAIYRLQAASG